jgi:hypothetical protein
MSPSEMALTGHSGRQTPQATQSSEILSDNPDHHPFVFDYIGTAEDSILMYTVY